MGAKLIAGRLFNQGDAEGKPRVMIIDERLAQRFWPDGNALGKRLYFPQDINDLMKKPPEDQMFTIVGIIETMRLRGLVDTQAQKTGAYFYPLRQSVARTLGVAIRTTVSPDSVTASVRRELAQIDPEMPFYAVRTMEESLSTSLMDRRTPMLLAAGFAAVALFLAAIGIYGVLAYQVSQRRREIGIRMALGAEQASIFNLVLREGGLIVALGAVFGVIGAFFLRQTLQSQLYETGAMDPRVVGAVAVMLIVVAMIACVVPARRAAKTDPLIALTDQ
jgi:putative ABC transport system permease protein